MSELASIVRCARALRKQREPFLLATVVDVHGSAYRRPGARLLVTASQLVSGSISAGCLEGDVIHRGFWRTRDAPAVLVTYDASSDEDSRRGFGIGCDGVIEVLLERVVEDHPCDPIEILSRALDDERTTVAATVFRSVRKGVAVGARVVLDGEGRLTTTVGDERAREELMAAARKRLREGAAPAAWCSSDGQMQALIELLSPPPRLFVFGSSFDAVPVVTLAKTAGLRVSVCDRQARFVTRERFLAADDRLVLAPPDVAAAIDVHARSLAVVMSHDYEYDREVVRALLGSRALYIGLLGPRRRAERIFEDIGEGAQALESARIHAPVGLDVGADEPSQVALSIVAETLAALNGTSGRRLRDRRGGIHARASEDVRAGADAE